MNVDAKLNAVAANVKKRRNELRVSQMQMADMLNITQNAYSKIEMAKTKMSVERLYEIADILKVSVADLMTVNAATMHPAKQVANS
ncbi:helix-turn-helix domain-containing protein [Mucilaginibacter ximonensis]|uniref:Helix-turn-helix domain-containing protein n=1 Tax=Mucilaginibacter ximonensis TaxID=538021 RepID=A0ABW5YF07_9SPHI